MIDLHQHREKLTLFGVNPQVRSWIDWFKIQIMRLLSIYAIRVSLSFHKDSLTFDISSTSTFAETRGYSRIHNRWSNSNH